MNIAGFDEAVDVTGPLPPNVPYSLVPVGRILILFHAFIVLFEIAMCN